MRSVAFILLVIIFSLFAGVSVESTNTTQVGLYEKFEMTLTLGDFDFDNPYDPEQIDIYAIFKSPSGKTWRLFAFYDEYQNANAWKVRFSPNEIGEWQYTVFAQNATRRDSSESHIFIAEASEHDGWIKVSERNPHYLEHDNGSGFFGIGMYTPWRNDVDKFDELQSFGGNTFAIWNIIYGGMTNGYGLIEEELGVYNQVKCGKIDELLQVAEERNLKCMYCFWPHDLFSQTVWAHQWHLNPYNQICDVVDVYDDSLCWEYQKKQYRYLIARYSYSRSLGIWEIMNEINGTDGWAAGKHDEAREWVHKVHEYFHANDPYQHLTTASRSGGFGEYWPELYEIIDLPNIHVYETQGWPVEYTGDYLRSSMYNYAWAAQRFWTSFDKPGIFGEAGADWVHVDTYSPEYTALYHNAIWACLTNGNATLPYWWTFTNPITVDEREQMHNLSVFAKNIDFINESKQHFEETTSAYDIFGMKNDSTAFAWLRHIEGSDISETILNMDKTLNADVRVYDVEYFDTWTGEILATHNRPHVNHHLRDTIPAIAGRHADVALKLRPAQGGDIPARLELSSNTTELLNRDDYIAHIECYVFDKDNRFCPDASLPLSFQLAGAGALVNHENISIEQGFAGLSFQATEKIGAAQIIVTSPGLIADTLTIQIKDKTILDDFESYLSNEHIRQTWQVMSSSKADITLIQDDNNQAMQIDYGIGDDYRFTSIFERPIQQDFANARYFCLQLQADGSNRELEIKIYNADNKYWTYKHILTGTQKELVCIALSEFSNRNGLVLDPSQFSKIRFTIRKGDVDYGTGTLIFDELTFTFSELDVQSMQYNQPQHFELLQNFPNPFNPQTNIRFQLAKRSNVKIDIYNINGQKVKALTNSNMPAGEHIINWQADATLSSGIYFYAIQAGNFNKVRKCILAR